MVVVDPLLLAAREEVADRAVVDRQRVRRRLRRDELEEPRPRAPEVGVEVSRPERLALPRPEHEVHLGGFGALEARDLRAVEAELQQVRRLRPPRELRVGDLVAPVAERGRRVDALEEVGEPAPPVGRDQDALVDHLGAGTHRLLGLARGALEIPVLLALAAKDRDDVLAVREQRVEVRALVLVALAPDQRALRVIALRPRDLTARDAELEPSQMPARQERAQIRGREEEPAVPLLHHEQYLPASGADLCRCDEHPSGVGSLIIRVRGGPWRTSPPSTRSGIPTASGAGSSTSPRACCSTRSGRVATARAPSASGRPTRPTTSATSSTAKS